MPQPRGLVTVANGGRGAGPLRLTPLELLDRLAALVPPNRPEYEFDQRVAW